MDFLNSYENDNLVLEEGSCLESLIPEVANSKRIMPNDLIRSNLFTVINHNVKREHLKNKTLVSLAKAKITYTGEELRQDDEDVWMEVIFQISKSKKDFAEFYPYSFVNSLGWRQTTQYKEKLKDCLTRMSATSLSLINNSTDGLTISLIRKFSWQDEQGDSLKKWKVWIEPEVQKLFLVNQFTRLYWEQRKELRPLAKWLHSYYTSHAEPMPVPIKILQSGSGSKTKELKHFKLNLRESLHELRNIGFLEGFWIDTANLVHAVRKKQKINNYNLNYNDK